MDTETLPPHLREQLDAALDEGERVCAAFAPRWSWGASAVLSMLFFDVVWVGFLVFFSYVSAGGVGAPMVFMLPFWLVGVGIPVGLLVYRARVLRTRYFITNRRAVVLRPSLCFSPQVVAWPLSPNMVKQYTERAHGMGDIVLGYKNYEVNDAPAPDGFLNVPNVREVYHTLMRLGGADASLPPQEAPQQFAPLLNGARGNMPQQRSGCVGGVFFVVGSIFLGLGLFLYSGEADLEESGIAAQGTVVKMVRSDSSRNSHSYFPVVRFEDTQGVEHTVKSSCSASGLQVGDTVSLRYSPENPQELAIGEDDSWLLYVFIIILGGVAQLLGLVGMLAGRRKKQAAPSADAR